MEKPKRYKTEEERKQAKKEYMKQYCKQRYQENREKLLEQQKQYYQDNKGKVLEQQKQYYQDNKEKIAERYKQYIKQYKQTPMGRAKNLISAHKQEDKKYNRGECTLTAKWIVDHIFTSKCIYCGESEWTKLGCDRKDNSLPHTPYNVVCCCEACNKKRGTKSFEEFLNEKQKKEAS